MIAATATDTGMLRERNEDRYWVDADRGVFLKACPTGALLIAGVAADAGMLRKRNVERYRVGTCGAFLKACPTGALQ